MSKSSPEIQAKMQAQVLAAMPFTPIALDSLKQSKAFCSNDAQLVRAAIALQDLSIRRAGVVTGDLQVLAVAIGVDAQWLQANINPLMDGFERQADGTWLNSAHAQIAHDMFTRYETQLKDWHVDSMAYAASMGLEFEALKPGTKRQTTKRLKECIDFSSVGKSVITAFTNRGIIEEEDMRFVVQQCCDYHISRGTPVTDTDAMLRTWISRVNLRELPSQQKHGLVTQNSSHIAFGQRGHTSVQTNMNGFSRVRGMQFGFNPPSNNKKPPSEPPSPVGA